MKSILCGIAAIALANAVYANPLQVHSSFAYNTLSSAPIHVVDDQDDQDDSAMSSEDQDDSSATSSNDDNTDSDANGDDSSNMNNDSDSDSDIND